MKKEDLSLFMPNSLISGVKFTVHTVFVVYINTGKTTFNFNQGFKQYGRKHTTYIIQYVLPFTIPTPPHNTCFTHNIYSTIQSTHFTISTPLQQCVLHQKTHFLLPPLCNTYSTIKYLLHFTIPTSLYNTYSTNIYNT